MWRPVVVSTPPAAEPLSLASAKRQVGILPMDDDTTHDDELNELIPAARAHVERVTGTKLYTQTVTIKTNCWADLWHLPIAPVQSLTIAYVDAAGASQTLSAAVYEPRLEGLEPQVVLKFGQSWPSIQDRSLITVTAVVGYGVEAAQEPDIIHAMKIVVADMFKSRESGVDGTISVESKTAATVESLLANHKLHLIT